MKYFRNISNNSKYATQSEYWINKLRSSRYYKEISKIQYDKLEDIF